MLSDLVDVNVPLGRNAKFGNMLVRIENFSEHVHEHVYSYGLRQILNDAMADKTDDDGNPLPPDQIIAKAQKRLDALYAGELRVRNGSSAEPIDPEDREAFRMARDKITEQFKSLGIWPKKGPDKFQQAVDARRIAKGVEPMTAADYIAAWLEINPKIVAAAKRIVAERAKSDNVSDLI
jgi:hypothetical protein